MNGDIEIVEKNPEDEFITKRELRENIDKLTETNRLLSEKLELLYSVYQNSLPKEVIQNEILVKINNFDKDDIENILKNGGDKYSYCKVGHYYFDSIDVNRIKRIKIIESI